MDPNELLRRILELARGDESDTELAEEILDLHRWFLSGGYLPRVWADRIKARPLLPESDSPWVSPGTALKGKEPF